MILALGIASVVLLAVLVVLHWLAFRRQFNLPSPRTNFPHLNSHEYPSSDLEILHKSETTGQWEHHSFRHPGHPDIAIYAKSPRFNVKQADGTLMRESD